MKVKKNDTVLVLTGKDNGKTGKVLSAFPAENRIKVDGVNVQKRSKKARSQKETSGIVEQVGKIDASNVLVICPSCKKATRVGHSIEGDKKIRVCKKCGASLDAVKATKAKETKKTAKKADKAEKPAKETKAKKTKTTSKKNEAEA